MFISLIFSAVLFRVSSNELDRGLRRQGLIMRGLPTEPDIAPNNLPDFEDIRLNQLAESQRHLLLNLIYFNLLILFLSAGLSYWLAKETLKPIEEMVQMQSRFTADASHELRTPLTAMKTEIEVLQRNKKFKSLEVRKLLKSNLEEIGKLETLSAALLKLANFEHNKILPFQKNDLNQILKASFGKIKLQAFRKKIKFNFKIKNAKIKSDKQSLIDLFSILMDNAIKYSPKESQVFISSQKIKTSVRINIKDQGIGILEKDLVHIFDRFYRADISRSKNKIEGYGLGLAIAKKIVEMHKGSIKAKSRLGQGATFTVTLPLA